VKCGEERGKSEKTCLRPSFFKIHLGVRRRRVGRLVWIEARLSGVVLDQTLSLRARSVGSES